MLFDMANMDTAYRLGDRVRTPYGAGTVAYVRMSPPDFRTIAAVSVVLDSRRADPRYTGTIVPANQVQPE
jgi:hypothetical protein